MNQRSKHNYKTYRLLEPGEKILPTHYVVDYDGQFRTAEPYSVQLVTNSPTQLPFFRGEDRVVPEGWATTASAMRGAVGSFKGDHIYQVIHVNGEAGEASGDTIWNDPSRFLAVEPAPAVKLNESYVALIGKGYVRVGCQTFTWRQVRELAEVIKAQGYIPLKEEERIRGTDGGAKTWRNRRACA